MMVDDKVITLKERINGCMIRSMNGKELPEDGPEMQAIIAYIKFLGKGTPEGVRVAGMGLFPIADPPLAADATRGQKVYADLCASCHKDDGQGEPNKSPRLGYLIPPLWGDDSFNAAAGMAKLAHAAAYLRTNMPFGVRYQDPVLTVQQAWDVAAYMISKPRPPAPPEPRAESALAAELAAFASVAATTRLRSCRSRLPADCLAAKLGERSEMQHDR